MPLAWQEHYPGPFAFCTNLNLSCVTAVFCDPPATRERVSKAVIFYAGSPAVMREGCRQTEAADIDSSQA